MGLVTTVFILLLSGVTFVETSGPAGWQVTCNQEGYIPLPDTDLCTDCYCDSVLPRIQYRCDTCTLDMNGSNNDSETNTNSSSNTLQHTETHCSGLTNNGNANWPTDFPQTCCYNSSAHLNNTPSGCAHCKCTSERSYRCDLCLPAVRDDSWPADFPSACFEDANSTLSYSPAGCSCCHCTGHTSYACTSEYCGPREAHWPSNYPCACTHAGAALKDESSSPFYCGQCTCNGQGESGYSCLLCT